MTLIVGDFRVSALNHRVNEVEFNDLIGQFSFPGFHRTAGNKMTGIFRRRDAINIPG